MYLKIRNVSKLVAEKARFSVTPMDQHPAKKVYLRQIHHERITENKIIIKKILKIERCEWIVRRILRVNWAYAVF